MMVKTQYKLITAILMLASSAGVGAFTINLDYTYDNGFFSSDPSRKNIVEAAASYFESRITDTLDAIISGGGESMTANFSILPAIQVVLPKSPTSAWPPTP